MPITFRKIVRHLEETRRENGRDLERPYRVAVVAAVIENPYPSEYVEDVATLADELAPELSALLAPAVVELLGTEVEAFGKGVVVGMDGEVEHGSALIHNGGFGNPFRQAAQGTELLPGVEKRGLPGATMDIPLKHKLEARTRSHHQTFTLQVSDAPGEREMLVAPPRRTGPTSTRRPGPRSRPRRATHQTPRHDHLQNWPALDPQRAYNSAQSLAVRCDELDRRLGEWAPL